MNTPTTVTLYSVVEEDCQAEGTTSRISYFSCNSCGLGTFKRCFVCQRKPGRSFSASLAPAVTYWCRETCDVDMLHSCTQCWQLCHWLVNPLRWHVPASEPANRQKGFDASLKWSHVPKQPHLVQWSGACEDTDAGPASPGCRATCRSTTGPSFKA